ncbi:MAG: Hsp70 family protein, partial [Nitrospinota bacterium]
VSEYLLDGFIPECEPDDLPKKKTRAGLRSFGLDYETDTGLTRHLAKFLKEHLPQGETGERITPETVFFNGGVTKAGIFRERIVHVLSGWGKKPVTVLTGTDPDLAVSRGAAWYGFVKRGNSIRIKSGSAFSYYLGVESSMPAVPGFEPPMDALCVIPFGMENGSEAEIPVEGLGLIVGEGTEFRFFSSNLHQQDTIGTLVPDMDIENLKELPSLAAFLPDDSGAAGIVIPITLKVTYTEIGTIQVWCHEKEGERKWRLEFNLEKDLVRETSRNETEEAEDKRD